jgi:hypothetical protein
MPNKSLSDKEDDIQIDSNRAIVPLFDLNQIPPGSNVLVVGRRGVGKSFLVTRLLRQRRDSIPIVFCSKYVLSSYSQQLPHANVLDGFDEQKLDCILKKQVESNGQKEVVIAFDDVTNENVCLMENVKVRDVVKYGSSLNITTIFSSQHSGVYDETFRRNVDFVFLFNDNLVDNQTMAFKKYAHMFRDIDQFKRCYRQCTLKPHRCLVLDMRRPWRIPESDDEEHGPPDGVYSYKAKLEDEDHPAQTITWNHERRTTCPWFLRCFPW